MLVQFGCREDPLFSDCHPYNIVQNLCAVFDDNLERVEMNSENVRLRCKLRILEE